MYRRASHPFRPSAKNYNLCVFKQVVAQTAGIMVSASDPALLAKRFPSMKAVGCQGLPVILHDSVLARFGVVCFSYRAIHLKTCRDKRAGKRAGKGFAWRVVIGQHDIRGSLSGSRAIIHGGGSAGVSPGDVIWRCAEKKQISP